MPRKVRSRLSQRKKHKTHLKKVDKTAKQTNMTNTDNKIDTTNQVSTTPVAAPSTSEETVEIKQEEQTKERKLDRIVSCRKIGKQIIFLVKWTDSTECETVPAKIANLKYTKNVIAFYESILDLSD